MPVTEPVPCLSGIEIGDTIEETHVFHGKTLARVGVSHAPLSVELLIRTIRTVHRKLLSALH